MVICRKKLKLWNTFPVESDILLISSSSSCPILMFNLSISFKKSLTYIEPGTMEGIRKKFDLQDNVYHFCSCQICQRHFQSLFFLPSRHQASSFAWRPLSREAPPWCAASPGLEPAVDIGREELAARKPLVRGGEGKKGFSIRMTKRRKNISWP